MKLRDKIDHYFIRRDVLKRVTPSDEERSDRFFTLASIFSDIYHASHSSSDVKTQGSFAKGTDFKYSDVDVFVIYPGAWTDELMRRSHDELKHKLKQRYTIIERYASHPYFVIQHKGEEIDVVPCFDVPPTQIRSAVDRTPHHTKFMIDNLTKRQKDEVRLLKAFMKGVGIYGAESSVSGFSGYACEVLIHNHGSFLQVLEHFMNNPIGVGEETHIPDPVDASRNVIASVAPYVFTQMVNASLSYLDGPAIQFFFPIPNAQCHNRLVSEAYIYLQDTGYSYQSFTVPWNGTDEQFAHFRKLGKKLKNILTEEGFSNNYIRVRALPGRALFVYTFVEPPTYYIHTGPPNDLKDAVAIFRLKYPDAKFDGERWYVEKIRDFVYPLDVAARLFDGVHDVHLEDKMYGADIAELILGVMPYERHRLF